MYVIFTIYIIFIILIIYMIFIIYLYLLSGVSKNLPQRTAACMLRPYCYLLFVMIAHAQGCLVGANRHVLRPYCYLLFVMIAHAQGCLVGANRHVLRPYCYLLFVICYDCTRQMRPLVEGENVSRWFEIQSQSQAVCTAIDPRFHINRRSLCFTLRDG